MTTTITAADRVAAWNIRFLRPPPSDRAFAGCYQPLTPVNRFLTWARVLHDLQLCFNLSHCPQAVETAGKNPRFLALWFRQPVSTGGVSATIVPSSTSNSPTTGRPCCIYLENPVGMSATEFDTILNTPIDVATLGTGVDEGENEDEDEEEDSQAPTTLDLTLVLHDSTCLLPAWDLESHLNNGMSTLIHRY